MNIHLASNLRVKELLFFVSYSAVTKSVSVFMGLDVGYLIR